MRECDTQAYVGNEICFTGQGLVIALGHFTSGELLHRLGEGAAHRGAQPAHGARPG